MRYKLQLHLSQCLFILLAFAEANLFSQNHSLSPSPFNSTFKSSLNGEFDQLGSRAWTLHLVGSNSQLGKSFMESCTVTNIGSQYGINFFGGLVMRNGVLYTWNQSPPYQLWSIDTVTATVTFIYNIVGVPLTYLTGMTWDGTTMYGVSTSLSSSQIFTINITTGICTPIGTPTSVCPGAAFISGRLGLNYRLYSVDAVSDNFVRWNKATGVPTLIGSTGVDANIRDDAQFDSRDGSLYWMSTSGSTYGLRKIDTISGLSVLRCTYPTQGIGIAISEPPPMGITNNNNEIPNEYILEQNYPNPFNSMTTISFSIPKAGNVELRVYDVVGREVAVLVNEFKSVGNYSVEFDASSLTSGVYFYSLKAGDFARTKKMLLIK